MSFTGIKVNRQDSQESKEGHDGTSCSCSRDKNLSMSSLIMWNISKALERCPSIDLKSAMRAAHSELERESRDGAPMLSLPPEEQHLTCALLAWHQLGHRNADSLCEFVEANRNNTLHINANSNIKVVCQSSPILREPAIGSSSFELNSLKGPVIKLPIQETILMRVGSFQSNLGSKLKKGIKCNDDAKRKISAACCLDSACIAKLTELDKETNELRTRAGKLAKREATRIEILERAEAAWKDLEVSYQRRLNLAEEKESDIEKEIKRILEERNEHKNICKRLTDELRKQCAEAEEIRDRLGKVEEEVCCRACTRLQLNEESNRGDSALAEQHCRITQVDRDLQLKEEQARRKILTLEGEVESVRGLTLEVERATRADLGVIKENVKKVTDEANKEEKENNLMKAEVEKLRKMKNEMIQDLETCKIKCDKGMTGKIDELKSKKQKLIELKGKVLDCRCRIPLDVSVEAKRTPSLAVLCTCAEDDQVISESCSCTSLRNQLLSNLLGDLFGGLQSELGDSGSLMPCHLLKCLEDKHNWDRASDVKSNLGDYFSQLLVNELQIAIATSIEKYHAQWIGASCADEASYRRRLKNDQARQERDVEHQAQVLATELAEKLFEERADELTKKAKEIFSSGPPPCECKPQQEAVYRCLVKAPTTRKAHEASSFKRTLNDVTQLRAQLEDLRKESVKKEDLRHMEDKLKRILHRASRLENNKSKNKKKLDDIINTGVIDKPEYEKVAESANCDKAVIKLNDSSHIKNSTKITSRNKTGGIKKHTTKKDIFKKIEQSYAVNVCFCKNQQISNVLKVSHKSKKRSADTSNSKQIKPINLSQNSIENIDKIPGQISCPNDCTCFHKAPSNTSINKLLKTLTCCSFLNKSNEKTKTAEIENVNSNITFKDLNSINKSTHSNKKFTTTVSEYMGTVNFDKSNEKNCECVICTNNQKNEIVLTHSSKESKENIYQHEKDTHYPETSSRNFLQSNEKDVNNIYGESYISDMMKNSQMFSDACNYCVKLLGVTLADTSNNQLSTDINSIDASRSGTTNGTKCNLSTCKYGSALESKFLADTTKSKEEISNVNKDQKSCICCNNQPNTSDIEVNTFNLLEEHLKEKIKDVKQNFNFSISPDEEQKIYAKILEKVKRLITDNTSELSCKCLFENEKGSWSRACGLLKEYLKIKIKRAQCSCAGNNLADMVLPTVLDKVNALIENDFERLKVKYNGELINGSSNFIPKESKDESRNGNYNEPNIESQFKIEPQHAKIKSVKITDNVSAQVSINFNSQEKSCDPIYDIQNEDNVKKKSFSGFENSVYVTDCDCRYTYVTKSNESAQNNYTKASIQYENNNKRNPLAAGNGNNYLNTSSDTLALKPPYVGYTINCSCDHSLGPCVCNKSVIHAKKEQINDIWQSITSQSFPKDLTYIMRKNPISSDSEEIPGNERENEKYFIEKSHKDVCKNTNTDYHTNIALKDSFYKNNKIYRDSGTFDATKAETIKQKVPIDCFIRPENPSDSTEEYIGTCSCDCESVPICHIKMLVDDIKQKLMYSECICDPLSEEVCPLHSTKR